jgi:hypothetical protein
MRVSREELEKDMKDLSRRVTLSARRSTWAALGGSLLALLFVGYYYSRLIPMMDSLNIAVVDHRLRTLRLLCVLSVCLLAPMALYCARLLTGQALPVDEGK